MMELEQQLKECREKTRHLEERELYLVNTLRRFVDVFIYQQPAQRDQVFVCYSHNDIVWLRRLKTMLAPLIKGNIVNIWDDSMIRAGEKWREKIRSPL